MTPKGARAEYARRIHRALAHIDEKLDQPIELADLAAVAHFSPFHFHRLFTAWMGETMGEYLRRRRLEVAAVRLLTQPGTPVLSIALTVGFGSGEAFAHAFKERFGCSASQWRRRKADERAAQLRKLDQARRNPDQAGTVKVLDDDGVSQPLSELTMKVNVIEREAVRVAYLRYVGPYGAGVHVFWQRKFYPFLAKSGLIGRPIYGISHDDPTITAAEKCRYDTCVAVDADYRRTGDALVTSIPGGRYASISFIGTSETIGAAWTGFMRGWLPGSGYQLDARPAFEYYAPGAAFDEAAGTFECDIVIPLALL